MIYEFTLVLDREPTGAEVETLAAAGLAPAGAEGPHPALLSAWAGLQACSKRRRPDIPQLPAFAGVVRR